DAKWDPNQVLNIVYYYDTPLDKDWFAAFQSQLTAVGIKSQVELVLGAAADKRLADGAFDLFYEGESSGHPAKYGSWFKNTGSMAWSDDPTLFKLFDQAGGTADEQERRKLYSQIQKIVNETLPVIVLAKFIGVTAVNKRVKGFD